MSSNAEQRLPPAILAKAVPTDSLEYGWREADFSDVIEAARRTPMAVVGGQIQYIFPDATCELYWLNYDPAERKPDETWLSYCNRTAQECQELFVKITSSANAEEEAVSSFDFLKVKVTEGVDIAAHKAFIIYFDDSETDSYLK